MSLFRRLRSVLFGLVWNVRASGLRGHVESISARVDQLLRLSPSPASIDPAIAQLLQQLLSRSEQLQTQVATLEDKLRGIVEGGFQEQLRTQQRMAWREVGDLRGYTFKSFAQNGEDGILLQIFNRIGATNRFFVEFGVEDGLQCNTRYLANFENWGGVYFEPDDAGFRHLQGMWAHRPDIRPVHAAVTSANFETLLSEANVPQELDLLSIDIDGNDYWVWKSLVNWRPRVVVIEYNPFHLPPKKWVMAENPNHRWDGSVYFGASFTSLRDLGVQKGYRLVGSDPNGVNAFFVRDDCIKPGQFIDDPGLLYHFSRFGHDCIPRPGTGPFVEV